MMSTRLPQRLHDQLHKLPGMPPHEDAQRLNANPYGATAHRPSLQNRRPALRRADAHHTNPPRVLVRWQEWIGGLFGPTRG